MRRHRLIIITTLIIFFSLGFIKNLTESKEKQSNENNKLKSESERCLEQNRTNPYLPCVDDELSNKSPSPVSPSSTKTPLPPKTSNNKNFSLPLTGYKDGRFLHPNALSFCNMISQRIKGDILDGNKPTIIITGFADGGKNIGVSKEHEIPTAKCNIVKNKTINDEDLARLRSCVIWELLSDSLNRQGMAIIFGWDENKIEDIKDGGKSGDIYRKVEVEVTWQ